jgi:hypothetical protein
LGGEQKCCARESFGGAARKRNALPIGPALSESALRQQTRCLLARISQDIGLAALMLFAKNPSIKPFVPGNAPTLARGGFFGLIPVILAAE